MIHTIYIEETVLEHPRTREILQRHPDATQITCHRYTEIFNRKSQNFRLQKMQPALILASKYKNHVLSVPANYGLGARHNYYFSHMLNCIYDCRYCFLQGMFRSAHYVLFVNYEDFATCIQQKIMLHGDESIQFFSGYDCDSLAWEPVTRFTEYFLPLFERNPHAILELRTKSTQIRTLLNRAPLDNVVIAWSFTPQEIAVALEHKTPEISKRIDAMVKLQAQGWQTGVRFDPLIYNENFHENYARLFNTVFGRINTGKLHSVSLGSFRLPEDYFHTIQRLYPRETLFASPLEIKDRIVKYKQNLESEMLSYCSNQILTMVPADKFFPCYDIVT